MLRLFSGCFVYFNSVGRTIHKLLVYSIALNCFDYSELGLFGGFLSQIVPSYQNHRDCRVWSSSGIK